MKMTVMDMIERRPQFSIFPLMHSGNVNACRLILPHQLVTSGVVQFLR